MKKMEGLFKRDPPKRPITSLEAVVEDWTYRFGAKGKERHRRDTVVEYCRIASTLASAIERACASKNAEGKMHNHQSRVRQKVLSQFATDLKLMMTTKDNGLWDNDINFQKARTFISFDQLYDAMEAIQPWGIGEVTLYDVATRIGAFLKLEPTSLYLHAGPREAWDTLHGKKSTAKRIPKHDLPKVLRSLPPDEVEDCLCAYREFLGPWLAHKGVVR